METDIESRREVATMRGWSPIWTVVGVLAIIALLIFILPHFH